jgi:hypothetical protein
MLAFSSYVPCSVGLSCGTDFLQTCIASCSGQ